ncbi:MAG: hypothetical protein IJT08_00820 [Alphaproteobacteria bacterium]|nr:hypothetical protein [Alphaproteobacteria bacterium]
MKKLLMACLFTVCGGASASSLANTSPELTSSGAELVKGEVSLRFCDDCVYAYPTESLKGVSASVKFDCEKDRKRVFVPSSDIFSSVKESKKVDSKSLNLKRSISNSSVKTKDCSFGEDIDADVEFRFGNNFHFGVQLNGWKIGKISFDTDRISITAHSNLCIDDMDLGWRSRDAAFISLSGSIEIARLKRTYCNDIFVYAGNRLSVCDAKNMELLVKRNWWGTCGLDRLAVVDGLEKGDGQAFDQWFLHVGGHRGSDGSMWIERLTGEISFRHLVCETLSVDGFLSTLVDSFEKSCLSGSSFSAGEKVISYDQMEKGALALSKLGKNVQMFKLGSGVLPDYVLDFKADEFGRLHSDTLFKVEVDRFVPVGYSELEGYANKAYVKLFEKELRENKERAKDEAWESYREYRINCKKRVTDADKKANEFKNERDALSKALDETKVELEKTKVESSETKKKLEEDLSSANSEISRLKSELGTSNRKLSESESDLARMRRVVSEELGQLCNLFSEVLHKDSFSHVECDNGEATRFMHDICGRVRWIALRLDEGLKGSLNLQRH